MQLKGEYKGYEIKADDVNDDFYAFIGSSTIRESSLKKLKSKIDNLEKKGFKKTNVFINSGWSNQNWIPGTVTSHADDDSVWIKTDTGSRSKVSVSKTVLNNKANRDKIEKIKNFVNEIEKMKKEITDIVNTLTKYSIKEAECKNTSSK